MLGTLSTSCDPDDPLTLTAIRRGAVYILVEDEAEVRVDVRMAPGHTNYAYVFGPDGRTRVRKRIGHPYRGVFTERISEPGLYTLLVSPSHRTHVTVTGGQVVHEPEREFPSLYLSGKHHYAFEVPENTDRFTFASTNQFEWGGSAGAVRLFDPAGTMVHEAEFEDLDQARIMSRLGVTAEMLEHYRAQGDTAEAPEFHLLVDRHEVVAPASGLWRVEAEISRVRPDDIGFWLEGIPNYVSPVGAEPFVPEFAPVTARVEVDAGTVLSPTGDVGTVWGWTVEQERVLDIYRDLGLTASKNFYPQVDMEPANDDGDSFHIEMNRFLFRGFKDRVDPYRNQTVPLTSLMTISRIAPWAAEDLSEVAEFAEAAVRFHQVDERLDPEGLYWQFLNEPNHEVSLDEYMAAYTHVGRRLDYRLEGNGIPVKLGGPGTGNASGDRNTLPMDWIKRMVVEADSLVDFVVWNQYRLWRIEDTWRYRSHIEKVDSLLTAHDTDGEREEILVGATNLRGGIVLQNEKQDGWYSAIWWPSVLCQTLGSGRCRLVNYFFLIDQGARRKGLLFPDWSSKPVALATGFSNAYRGDEVLAAGSDHDGVDVLATRTNTGPGRSPNLRGTGLTTLLVNKMPREVTVTVAITDPSATGSWNVDAERFLAEGGIRQSIPDAAIRVTATGGEIEVIMPPRSLVGISAQPVSSEAGGS